ncbi:putative cysteine proteinase inhibitor 4 [Iris pallida]|uniref:Cysteine proteinase inhibitor 4 n=1 Tax=Iris pallida TaxID=29817 RepID=A0AAX6EZ17_IRIPA|nr:putative cysteine proteinase inhibitor 4 [Iris pallida]
MSSFSFSSLLLLSFLLLLLSASSVSSLGEQAGGKVGGRTEIKDAATDEKVRSLGRFAVEEHNRSLFLGGAPRGHPVLPPPLVRRSRRRAGAGGVGDRVLPQGGRQGPRRRREDVRRGRPRQAVAQLPEAPLLCALRP